MATVNKGGQARHDGQRNYDHSNQRNPDNVRNATQKHQYKDLDVTLTDDAEYQEGQPKGEFETDDKNQNVEKH